MGDIDNIKDKLLNYHSPLDIDEAWEELTLKQENVTLKKELRTRNIIGGALGAGLLIIGGIWLMTSINTNSNETITNNKHSNNQTITQNEAIDDKALNPGKTINLEETLTKEENIEADDIFTLKKASISTKNETNSEPKSQTLDSNANIHLAKKTRLDISTDVNNLEKQKIRFQKVQENTKLPSENTQTTKKVLQKTQPVASISTPAPTPLIQTNKQQTTAVTIQTLAAKYPLINQQKNTNLLQTTSPVLPKYKFRDRGNFVGLELLGQGGLYSVNYGRVISKQRFGETNIQLGASIHPRRINGTPLNMHRLMGTLSLEQVFRVYKPHHLTLGLTAVFATKTTFVTASFYPSSYYDMGVLVPKLGYRYCAPESRIFYKAELIFYRENIYSSYSNSNTEEKAPSLYPSRIPVWGGVGIGYKF